MQKNSTIVGIDIGSSFVRTVIAQDMQNGEKPRVIGVGVVPSFGMRRGVIVDTDEVIKTINESVEAAERMAGFAVKSALVSIGGSEVAFQSSKGVIAVGRADGEVTEEDVNRVIGESQLIQMPMNKEIIHVIPKKYRLDDQDNIKDPVGMKGVRLEVDALIIESSASQVKNLTKCVYQAGIEIDDIVLSPLVSAKAVLSKKQRELGVAMVNIGGGTTSLAVYEEGELLHTSILPVGAGHITNDIAIGLRTSVETAEIVKLEYGVARSAYVDKNEEIDLSLIDSKEDGCVSRYHVAEIVEARLEEIFDLVLHELRLIGKAGLLPSGVVITGGGSKMPHLVEMAKDVLNLPIQIGFPQDFSGVLDKFDDPSFATAAGLIKWGQERRDVVQESGTSGRVMEIFSKNTSGTVDVVKKWMKKFLP